MTHVVLPVWQSQKADSKEAVRLSCSVILVGGEFRLFPIREFKGDTAFRTIGRTTSYDYDQNGHETWFDAGLGADISVSRNTKLWLDSKYVFGGEFENTWALNAGVRWEF